jgi:hypothetical protein
VSQEQSSGLGDKESWLDDLATAAWIFGTTELLVLLGAVFAAGFVVPSLGMALPSHGNDLISSLCAGDGYSYNSVASHGYFIPERGASNVAFFPLYPLLGRALAEVTGCDVPTALVLLANGAFFGVVICLIRYARQAGLNIAERSWAGVWLAIFPTAFFFRMAHSESLFLLLALLIFIGMRSRWNLLLLIFLAGLLTATRPVGVAIIPALLVHADGREPRTRVRMVMRLAAVVGLSTWGLVAYMLYQWAEFGDALAFVRVQEFWSSRNLTFTETLLSALTLEAAWSNYIPGHACCWDQIPPQDHALFNYRFMTPLLWGLFVVVLIAGTRMRMLSWEEIAYLIGIIGIPLFLQGPRACFASQARYILVAFPGYLVMGRFAARFPGWAAAPICGLSVAAMLILEAMAMNWYGVY